MSVIDLHTHGIEGLDTRTSDPETIRKIAEMQGKAGVTEIVLSIYSGPIRTMREQMMAVKKAMELQLATGCGEESLPLPDMPDSHLPAHILGVHLEGPFLNPLRCGALDPATFIEPREAAWRELVEGYEDMVRVVTIAPEREGAPALIKKMDRAGVAVNMGHSDATYAEAETGFRAGARGITHLFNAMSGLHHRKPGLAAFGLLQKDIYIEVIADLRHLHEKIVELVLRLKGPDKCILVSDSVRETRIHGGQPPTPSDQSGRLLGGSMTLAAASRLLMDKGFDRETVMRAVSVNPRDYLNKT
jgi:N-acetylglucosamine-6-phosphate deacetylase